MRRIAVLDAPSNLGLRPPTATSVPGCAKAPGALRDRDLLGRLNARDAGCLTPPRYDPGDWRPGDGVAHAAQIAAYSRALADRIGAILDAGEFPVVLGGDCSILLGSGLAMHRLGEAVGGRIGLVFVDGHSDFRHPGNASYVGAAAGEDLALATGRGQADLAAIEGRRPYFRDIDVVVLGIRAQDEYRLDLQAAGIVTRPVPALRAEGAARSAQWARDQLVDCAGYWVHVDVDVLDPAVMPAVDAPSPGGIAFPELELLLAGLVESPHCLGVEITVFDPDYDPDGSYAAEITSAVVAGLAAAHTVTPRPDLIAARADLNRAGSAAPAASSVSPASASAGSAASVSPASASAGSGASVSASASVASASAASSSAVPVSAGERFPSVHNAAASEPDHDREARRAAAAAESVPLAAAGISAGLDSAPEETGAPAATVLGVAEAGDLAETVGEIGERAQQADDADGFGAGDAGGDGEGFGGGDAGDGQSGDDAGAEPTDLGDDAVIGDAPAEDDEAAGDELAGAGEEPEHEDRREPPGRTGIRPLGIAPLLDSEPLPATRPGMLRPRVADEPGFTLPVQRPAFDLGSDEPADVS